MYRHPPPRKCPSTGYNHDLNCVSFFWSWNGWICLYCNQTIGRAPAEISPGVSEKEEAAAMWYRDRYRRQDEWCRRVHAGIETQPWHVGWEPTAPPQGQVPHVSHVTHGFPVGVGHHNPTPPVSGFAPTRSVSAAAAHAEMMNSYSSALELSKLRMHLAQSEIRLQPAAPSRCVEVDMEEYLASPARRALEIAEDVELADAALVPCPESGVSSPTVDSPMQVEAAALEDKIPSGSASPLPSSPAEAPFSDPMTPMTPHPVMQLVLQTAEKIAPPPTVQAPHSPTSSAIAALLDDDGPPRKKPRTKAPGRKTSAAGGPGPRRARQPKSAARAKEKDLRSDIDPKPSSKMSPKRKTPGGAKASHLVTKSALTALKPPSTPPKPSPEALGGSPARKPPPPPKAWQITRIPKRMAPTVGGKNPAQCTPHLLSTPDRTPTSSPATAETYLPSGTYSTHST